MSMIEVKEKKQRRRKDREGKRKPKRRKQKQDQDQRPLHKFNPDWHASYDEERMIDDNEVQVFVNPSQFARRPSLSSYFGKNSSLDFDPTSLQSVVEDMDGSFYSKIDTTQHHRKPTRTFTSQAKVVKVQRFVDPTIQHTTTEKGKLQLETTSLSTKDRASFIDFVHVHSTGESLYKMRPMPSRLINEDDFFARIGVQPVKRTPISHCDNCPSDLSNGDGHLSMREKLKQEIHVMLDDVDHSRLSRIINFLLISMIVLSTAGFCASTLQGARGMSAWYIIEVIVNVIFTIEYVVKMYCCRSVLLFHTKMLNVIDVLSIVPFYFELMVPADLDIFRVFRAVRLVRLFRIFKFPGLNVYSRILGITFKKASAMFATMLFVSFLAIIVFASVFFSLERGTYDAEQDVYISRNSEKMVKFDSILGAMWWALQTLTAEGYGDVFPFLLEGKVTACIGSICGILVLSLPVSIIGTFFTQAFHEVHSENATIRRILMDMKIREKDLHKRFRELKDILEEETVLAEANYQGFLNGLKEGAVSFEEEEEEITALEQCKNSIQHSKLNHIINTISFPIISQLRATHKFVLTCRLLPDPDLEFLARDDSESEDEGTLTDSLHANPSIKAMLDRGYASFGSTSSRVNPKAAGGSSGLAADNRNTERHRNHTGDESENERSYEKEREREREREVGARKAVGALMEGNDAFRPRARDNQGSNSSASASALGTVVLPGRMSATNTKNRATVNESLRNFGSSFRVASPSNTAADAQHNTNSRDINNDTYRNNESEAKSNVNTDDNDNDHDNDIESGNGDEEGPPSGFPRKISMEEMEEEVISLRSALTTAHSREKELRKELESFKSSTDGGTGRGTRISFPNLSENIPALPTNPLAISAAVATPSPSPSPPPKADMAITSIVVDQSDARGRLSSTHLLAPTHALHRAGTDLGVLDERRTGRQSDPTRSRTADITQLNVMQTSRTNTGVDADTSTRTSGPGPRFSRGNSHSNVNTSINTGGYLSRGSSSLATSAASASSTRSRSKSRNGRSRSKSKSKSKSRSRSRSTSTHLVHTTCTNANANVNTGSANISGGKHPAVLAASGSEQSLSRSSSSSLDRDRKEQLEMSINVRKNGELNVNLKGSANVNVNVNVNYEASRSDKEGSSSEDDNGGRGEREEREEGGAMHSTLSDKDGALRGDSAGHFGTNITADEI